MHLSGSIFAILMSLSLLACQHTNIATPAQHNLLHDASFPDYGLFEIETPEQIFALSDEAKAFVEQSIEGTKDPGQGIKQLIARIFDHSELDLLYAGNANTIAAETFANRAANCLSMSILTYAMARHAGFSAQFQDIQIPELWTRNQGYSLLNGHINLRLFPATQPHVYRFMPTGYLVDFDPQPSRQRFPKRIVSIATVLAMFYNNKAADALVANQYTKAYAYSRAALQQNPNFDAALVNLGFLYRQKNQLTLAEASYRRAIELDTYNFTAWENLAVLYQKTQRHQQAKAIWQRIAQHRKDNPHYHYILGEQALDNQEYQQALRHFRNALRLDKRQHQIYFGLAKAYYALGDLTRGQFYLQKAQRTATNTRQQQLYLAKLQLFEQA